MGWLRIADPKVMGWLRIADPKVLGLRLGCYYHYYSDANR